MKDYFTYIAFVIVMIPLGFSGFKNHRPFETIVFLTGSLLLYVGGIFLSRWINKNKLYSFLAPFFIVISVGFMISQGFLLSPYILSVLLMLSSLALFISGVFLHRVATQVAQLEKTIEETKKLSA